MEQVVRSLVELVISIVALGLIFWLLKYWLDNYSEKFFDEATGNIREENKKLKKKLKICQQLNSDAVELIKNQQEEIEELKLERDLVQENKEER